MAPRDFFVCLDMIYKCTDFHSSRAFGMAGLIIYNLLGGAVESFLPRPLILIHIHVHDRILYMCDKFSVDHTFCVEVRRTKRCMAKHQN